MRGICPNCEKERDLDFIQMQEEINVRGDVLWIPVEFYRCHTCGDEFEDPESKYDPLDKAYREYRRKHGMIQPEEIRDLRKKYGLTQHELAKLLGWGLATLSRYENGALQNEAHDKILRLALKPDNLIRLIMETPDALPEERREDLIAKLKASEEVSYSLEKIYEERFGAYEPDILSGYHSMNLKKLFNAMLFFCVGGLFKTFLNKVLFYSDFKHFKEYSISITGSRYAGMPFGPAPDKWHHFFSLLIEEGAVENEEVFFNEKMSGEKLTSIQNPDLSIFTNSELFVLTSVKEHFKDWTAKQISEFSHNEKGYKETPNGHLISYAYAEELQI